MKRTKMEAFLTALLIALLIVNVLWTTAPSTARAAGSVQYRVVLLNRGPDFESELNKYGAEGWELIAITDASASSHYIIFKR
jgi:hypothetical protein